MHRGDRVNIKSRGDLEYKGMAQRDKIGAENVNEGKCYATRRL